MGMIRGFFLPQCTLPKEIFTKIQPGGIWEAILTKQNKKNKQEKNREMEDVLQLQKRKERMKCGK